MYATPRKNQENESKEVCMMSTDSEKTTTEKKPEAAKPAAKKTEEKPKELPAFEKSISDPFWVTEIFCFSTTLSMVARIDAMQFSNSTFSERGEVIVTTGF